MRIPLAVNLESRDGGVSKDAKGLNAIGEVKGEGDIRFRKRPGSADLGLIKAGPAQLLYNWNGLNAIIGDYFNRGTITTVVSGPTQTYLPVTVYLNPSDKSANLTLSNNNLTAVATSGSWQGVRGIASTGISSGKKYWEVTYTGSGADHICGIGKATASLTSYVGSDANGWGLEQSSGNSFTGGASSAFTTAISGGETVGFALDMDGGTLKIYRANALTGTMASGLVGTLYPMVSPQNSASTSVTVNFGATAFTQAIPSGYSAYQTAFAAPNAQMSGQATNNDASTPRFMFKNRAQAWYMNRAGTIASVSYASNMGAGTYSIISLTRVSTTATATLAEDIFNVGDTVTVAGATDAAYNGARTVTAVTSGSSIPASDIPITIVRDNGASLNPSDKDAAVTLSNTNTTATGTAGYKSVRGNVGKSSGKWYWETTSPSSYLAGIGKATAALSSYPGSDADGVGVESGTGNSWASGGPTAFTTAFTAGEVIGWALDMDAGTLKLYRAGALVGTVASGLSGTYYPMIAPLGTVAVTANFGASAFTYTAPTGYSVLSSATATATATTVSGNAHGLTTATAYTIAGANQSAYNGSKTITTSGGSTFTYSVTVTPGGTVTWNPADKAAGVTLSGGDLNASISVTNLNQAGVRATTSKTTGKWYWELTVTSASAANVWAVLGATQAADSLTSYLGLPVYVDTAPAVNDVYGVAVNLDSATVSFYKNNALKSTTALSGGARFPAFYVAGASSPGAYTVAATANFGATALTYTPPAGYTAWQADDPITPATGTITVTKPAATINPTFSYTVAGSPATPDTGATKTATANGGTVPGITYINGYFSVMDVNGVIWTSASDDPTTWPALGFVTAQFENGAGRALVQSANLNVALKEWSTEFFYDRQDAQTGSPFSPVDNGFTRIGCASGYSATYVGPGVAWIAQTKQEGRSVYYMIGTEQQRISTPDVDRILNADDLATVYAYGIEMDGHALYVLTLVTSNITLVYDLTTKLWGQWSSYTLGSSKSVTSITRDGEMATVEFAVPHTLSDGDPVLIAGADQTEYNGIFQALYVDSDTVKIRVSGSPTTPATGTITGKPYTESYFKYTKAAQYNGATLFLHESDGHLYQMDPDLKRDAGLPINWFGRTTRMDGGSTGMKRMASIEVIGDSVNDVAMIRWSDDDCATFSAYRMVDLSDDQPMTHKCGAFRRRTLEFRHVGNTGPVLAGLEMEIR